MRRVGLCGVEGQVLGLFSRKQAGPEGAFFIGAEPWAVAFSVALKKAGAVTRLVDPDHVRAHVARLEGADAEHVQPGRYSAQPEHE